MALRSFALVVGGALSVGLALPAVCGEPLAEAATKTTTEGAERAEKAPKAEKRKRVARRSKRARKVKVCKRRKGKRRCRWIREFSGRTVRATKLQTEPLPKPPGDIDIISLNHREAVTTNIYGADGELDDESLAKPDQVFRCKRSGRA